MLYLGLHKCLHFLEAKISRKRKSNQIKVATQNQSRSQVSCCLGQQAWHRCKGWMLRVTDPGWPRFIPQKDRELFDLILGWMTTMAICKMMGRKMKAAAISSGCWFQYHSACSFRVVSCHEMMTQFHFWGENNEVQKHQLLIAGCSTNSKVKLS